MKTQLCDIVVIIHYVSQLEYYMVTAYQVSNHNNCYNHNHPLNECNVV